jgi:hypothetical protein
MKRAALIFARVRLRARAIEPSQDHEARRRQCRDRARPSSIIPALHSALHKFMTPEGGGMELGEGRDGEGGKKDMSGARRRERCVNKSGNSASQLDPTWRRRQESKILRRVGTWATRLFNIRRFRTRSFTHQPAYRMHRVPSVMSQLIHAHASGGAWGPTKACMNPFEGTSAANAENAGD